jgi:hypothetical protein
MTKLLKFTFMDGAFDCDINFVCIKIHEYKLGDRNRKVPRFYLRQKLERCRCLIFALKLAEFIMTKK